MKHLPSLLCLILGVALTWLAPSIPTLSGLNLGSLQSTADVLLGHAGGPAKRDWGGDGVAMPMLNEFSGNHLQVGENGQLVWARAYQSSDSESTADIVP